MLTLLQLFALTIIINSICYAILRHRGYQIHHQYWILEQETTWRDQLEDHYETMYNDEFEALFEREDNLQSDNKFMTEELRKANRDFKKLHLKFSHFFSILIKDSKSNDFIKRNSSPEKVVHHFNNSLQAIMESIEDEMNLKPCKESSFIKRIFEDSRVEELSK